MPPIFAMLVPSGLSGFLIFAGKVGRSNRRWAMGMEERRRFPRTEINEPGFVSQAGLGVRWTRRNISAEGCAIEVNEPAFVPQHFRLVMANDSSIVRDCQIAWIQENRIGLTFVDPPVRAERAPDAAGSTSPEPHEISRHLTRAVI